MIFLCTVFLVLCFSFFWGGKKILDEIFKINEIKIENNTDYSEDEIITASGIKIGDSWLFINLKRSEEDIFKILPYTENIKNKREFWFKIKIKVDKAVPFFAVENEGEFLILSRSYKLLEIKQHHEQGTILIQNIKVKVNKKDSIIIFEDKKEEELLNKILKNFEENSLFDIKVIDVSNFSDVFVVYGAGIKILIGDADDMDCKVLTAKEILRSKIGVNQKGTLDLTSLKNSNKSYFMQEK